MSQSWPPLLGSHTLRLNTLVRSKMLKKIVGEEKTPSSKSRVDFARLPPCQDSLIPHIQWVNYRVAFYKRADEPNLLEA